VGLLDYFRRRRQRESAVSGLSVSADPSPQLQAMSAAGEPQPEPPDASGQPQQAGAIQPGALDFAQLGQIGAMMAQAAQSGNIQIQQGEAQTIDLRGSDLREQILGIMEQHGIDVRPGSGQQIDAGQIPGMQQEILDALSRAGVDVDALGGGRIDSTGGGLGADATGAGTE
jgi:hypothetical protein